MDVARSSGGGTPPKGDSSYWTAGTVPWVSPKDMKSFFVSSSEDSVTSKALSRLTLVPSDSVLVVVRSGILSRTFPVSINKLPVTVNQDMRAFVPERGIDARYLAWQLISNERDILVRCAKDGTTVASIEGPALAGYPFAIAPLGEQTRIVEKLEEILSDLDAGVAELKAAQRKLTQYRQSLLKAAVEGTLTADWRAARETATRSASSSRRTPGSSTSPSAEQRQELDPGVRRDDGQNETGTELLQRILIERRARWEAKQLAKFAEQGKVPPAGWRAKYPEPVAPNIADLPVLPDGWIWASLGQMLVDLRSGSAETSQRQSTTYPILKSSAVRQGAIDLSAVNFLYEKQSRRENFLELGDVLITRLSGSVEYVGCCAVVDVLPESGMQYPDRIFCGKLVSSFSSGEFLTCCLRSAYARKRIETAAKSTAGHKRISLSDLHPFPIPMPSSREIAEILTKLDASLKQIADGEAVVEHALKQAAAQRKNILKAAFAGQLVPQDPFDEPASVLLARIRAERGQGTGARAKHRAGSKTAPNSKLPSQSQRGRKAKEKT